MECGPPWMKTCHPPQLSSAASATQYARDNDNGNGNCPQAMRHLCIKSPSPPAARLVRQRRWRKEEEKPPPPNKPCRCRYSVQLAECALSTPGSSRGQTGGRLMAANCRVWRYDRADMKPFRSPSGRCFSIAAFELDARPKENPLAEKGRVPGRGRLFWCVETTPKFRVGGRVRTNGRAAILVGRGKVGEWPRSGLFGGAQRCSYEGQREIVSLHCVAAAREPFPSRLRITAVGRGPYGGKLHSVPFRRSVALLRLCNRGAALLLTLMWVSKNAI
ncbi:hypothetical protein QBC39DRAFT_354444 [Podospora conica]|nr:hypothetical protein QBC39DRAFT_354444 [Schizothecium conicum]